MRITTYTSSSDAVDARYLDSRPIVLCQLDGFWDGLLAFFEQLYDQAFAKDVYRRLYHVADQLDEVFAVAARPPDDDLPTKWY
jgi:predicted Rossmann-fold nucleotide-binding protein